jgi:hypothetical protein
VGPPVGDSVARCRASIGHRGLHSPAARAGIKLPDRNSCPKLLPCPGASLSRPRRRLRVSAAAAVFSLASCSAAVSKLRCQSTGEQRRTAVPLPAVTVAPAGPASRACHCPPSRSAACLSHHSYVVLPSSLHAGHHRS